MHANLAQRILAENTNVSNVPNYEQSLELSGVVSDVAPAQGKVVAFRRQVLNRAAAKAIVETCRISPPGDITRLKHGWRFCFSVGGHVLPVRLSDAVFLMIHVGYLMDSYVAGLPTFTERLHALVALQVQRYPAALPDDLVLEISDI